MWLGHKNWPSTCLSGQAKNAHWQRLPNWIEFWNLNFVQPNIGSSFCTRLLICVFTTFVQSMTRIDKIEMMVWGNHQILPEHTWAQPADYKSNCCFHFTNSRNSCFLLNATDQEGRFVLMPPTPYSVGCSHGVTQCLLQDRSCGKISPVPATCENGLTCSFSVWWWGGGGPKNN